MDLYNFENRRRGFDRRLERLDVYIDRRTGHEQRDIVRHRQVFIEKLKNTEQFRGLDENQLFRMLLIASRAEFVRGDVIIKEGDDADCMYILIDGHLRIEVDGNVTGTVAPIAFAGEVAPLTKRKRMATVIAECDCMLMRFCASELDCLFEIDKDLYKCFLAGVISDLSKKVQTTSQSIAMLKNTINL